MNTLVYAKTTINSTVITLRENTLGSIVKDTKMDSIPIINLNKTVIEKTVKKNKMKLEGSRTNIL